MSSRLGLRALLRDAAERHPAVEAVRDARATWTYERFDARVTSLARALAGAGVGPGERVAVVSRNRAEFAALYFACAELGAVLVPLNWRSRPAELERLLASARAVALFAESEFARPLAQDAVRGLRLRCSLDEVPVGAGWTAFEALASDDVAPPVHEVGSDEVVVQMYTSGTTGVPKGAMLTHANVCSLAREWAREIELRPETDRFLQVTPLFHVGGMLMLVSTVSVGATLLLHAEFQPDLALEALANDGVTHALFVPAMLQWLLLQPGIEELEFPRLRRIAYGAAPASPELLRHVSATFRCGLLQGYGLTETAGVLTVLRPEDHSHPDPERETARLASIGRAVACCEVRVVDEHDAPVAPGHVGEIVARGENVFPGYFEQPDATERALRDGWFRTGDLARVDDEGFITIVDRLKDMILVGGENVYPSEVERVLVAHGDVVDAAVVGIPHDVWGEEVLAFVQLEAGADADDRALIRHCRGELARFKCPTRVRFLERIPRNAAGKCEKAALRAPYWEGRERKV